MRFDDLGHLPYRDAWAAQEAAHADVLAGGPERTFLVEHPPVVTFGRRPGVDRHLLASPDQLARLGVDVVQSDRGGDITFHGLGQLVCYPVLRLVDHAFSVSGYVHWLEQVVVDTLAALGVTARADPAAVGVWTVTDVPAKVCAIGVRIRRGVTLHGLAMNVTTDLSFFDLIVPCGLQQRPVTSLQRLLGDAAPSMDRVKATLVEHLQSGLTQRDSSAGVPASAGDGNSPGPVEAAAPR